VQNPSWKARLSCPQVQRNFLSCQKNIERQAGYETEELFYVHCHPPKLGISLQKSHVAIGLIFYAIGFVGQVHYTVHIRLGKWLSMDIPCQVRTIYSITILQQNIFITGEGETYN